MFAFTETKVLSIKTCGNVICLGIALIALLTVLTLYVAARHHFFAMRQPPRVAYVDAMPQTHLGVAVSVDAVILGSHEEALSLGNVQFTVDSRSAFQLRGWALDSIARSALTGVVVRTDFNKPFGAVYGTSRPDVAAVMCRGCKNTGFLIDFQPRTVPTGVHKIWICGVLADGSALYVPLKSIVFRVI